jgi:hypothetical protein
MRHVTSRFLIGKSSMYTMPRLSPQNKRWLAPVSAFVLLVLVFFAGVDAHAQKKKPAPKKTPQQQGAGTNANTQTAQTKPQQKNITPLRSGDTSDGSRITITSDAPLNDYSAYRSGDRYYVVIPEANAPRAQGGLRGRGFEDVQVQKRGNDAILSFKLQPGTNARVSQRFNRLDVELTAPGGKTATIPTATPKATPALTPQPTPQTIARPTPQTATIQNPATTGNAGQPVIPGANNPALTQPATGANPSVVYAPTPDASASPGASPETSPVASPPTEQIAQAQPPPTSQPATTSAPSTSGTTLGTVLRQNWLVILIAALVLLSLLGIVAARSRAKSVAATPVRRTSRKERREAQKASAKLAEADLAAAETSSEVATPKYKTATLPKAKPVKSVPAIAAVDEAIADKEKTAPVLAGEETKEIEVAPAVDMERVETEVANVLTGDSYDEEIVGASDAGTRELVATGLLAALASRNTERRERAREAFIKHDYLDEATRKLRTAEAPAERAAAARSLGYVQDKTTTMHLVVALEDSVPEVRRAAVESLAELRDPAAVQPLKSLLKRERDRKVSRSLIKRAIEASAAAAKEEETTTLNAPATAPETETVTLEAPPVASEVGVPSIIADETPTLEAEAPALETEQPTAAALLDVSAAEVVPDVVAVAAPLVTEEADTEAEEAARREAEEEAARQQAEEERLRVEAEAERQAEEEKRLAAEAQAEEERRQAAEAARLRAEEEERAQVAAEEEARQRAKEEEERRQAEEEAARLRAEEQERERVAAEERRQAEEVAARLKLEQEAARVRAEEKEARRLEEERRAEEERLRLEEEARQRAEAEQKRAEEEAARLRAAEEERQRQQREEESRRQAEEAEARRQAEVRRQAEEAARLAAEAEAQRRIEEERARQLAAEEAAATLSAEAVAPVELEAAEEGIETFAPETPEVVTSVDPLIERNDATSGGWVEVDINEPEKVRHAEPVALSSAEESAAQPELLFAEPVLQEAPPVVAESKELEPAGFSIVEESKAPSASKEIDYAVTEKGVAEFDEFSTVPGAILKRLSSEEPEERASAVADLARVGSDDSFRQISAAFDDPAVEVRNAAARSLFSLNADRAATFTRALRESPPERRRKIGSALASSGLASEAIGQLMGESREKTYDAFSLLFLMSKAGEVQPLMRAIEEHPNNEVRLAVVKLLALSGQQEILPAFRRLAVRGSLPTEVRSAVMEAIYQISSQSPTPA